MPAFKKIFHVFVDERDKCLAYSIQECVRSGKLPLLFDYIILKCLICDLENVIALLEVRLPHMRVTRVRITVMYQ